MRWVIYVPLGKSEGRSYNIREFVELLIARCEEYAEKVRLRVGASFTDNGRTWCCSEKVMRKGFLKWSSHRRWSPHRHSGRQVQEPHMDQEPDRPAGGEQQMIVEVFEAEDWDPEHPDLQHEPPLVCTEDPVDFEPGEGHTDGGDLPAEIPDAVA